RYVLTTIIIIANTIRLQRKGPKNHPYKKMFLADIRTTRDGKFIEIICTYDPKKPGHNSALKLDRAEYWISKGAQASDTVRSLIKKTKKAQASSDSSSQSERGTSQSTQEEAPPPSGTSSQD